MMRWTMRWTIGWRIEMDDEGASTPVVSDEGEDGMDVA